jgi:hypothetical protein
MPWEMIEKVMLLKSITDRAFSNLRNIEFMVNPEFHSGLLQELPSAILVLL